MSRGIFKSLNYILNSGKIFDDDKKCHKNTSLSFMLNQKKTTNFMSLSRGKAGAYDYESQKKFLEPYVKYYEQQKSPQFPFYKSIFEKRQFQYKAEVYELIDSFASYKKIPNFNHRSWRQINLNLKNYVIFYFVNVFDNEFYQFICDYFGTRLSDHYIFFNELKGINIDDSFQFDDLFNVNDLLNVDDTSEIEIFDIDEYFFF